MNNLEMPREQSKEELAQIYLALENGAVGGDYQAVSSRKEEIFSKIAAMMNGETDVEKEGAAAAYLEELQNENLEQAA